LLINKELLDNSSGITEPEMVF